LGTVRRKPFGGSLAVDVVLAAPLYCVVLFLLPAARVRRAQSREHLLRETHFSAPQPPSQASPWFPRAHEHEERAQSACRATEKGPPPPYGLAPASTVRWYERLRRSSEIAFVRRRGRAASFACLTAYALGAPRARTCVAVSVGKAVGGAVTRNLVRRRVRGILDGLPPLGVPLRVLFVAKPAAATASFERLSGEVGTALARLSSAR
jgi:ribonuclease P protein component